MTEPPSQSVLSVLLFTDLVGSTNLKRRLGDVVCARVVAQHDRLFRDCLAQCRGVERDDTGDGFFATFDVPSEAVRCALAFLRGLASLDVPEPLLSRVGIHMGEIVSVSTEEVGGDHNKLVGLAVDTAARVMGLAQGMQVLLTRHAFDSVRQQNVTAPDGSPVEWLAHGPYLFKGVDDPMEVFEVGVPGISPRTPPPDSEKAKRAVTPGDESMLGWRPAVSLPVPGRESWVLQRKLGHGGFSEVWLARQRETHGVRAFKFCFEADRLRSLKRELTLFRLMKEVLGERPDIARLYEVQLEKPPYFLEMEYTSGGDLATWSQNRGGIADVALDTRLELIAQVADALAAAHSVGVLHKDVKPANVLIDERKDGSLQARLTDFGIGQLLERESAADAGITLTSFDTRPGVTEGETGAPTGTPLYIAPEVTAGKAPSIQSDIYALGVMLYQMVVSDLTRPIAHGWEREVPEELLREDIAACIAGSPADRLPTADTLAKRLRSLEQRNADRQAAQDKARRELQRRRLLRLTSAVAAVVSLVAAVAGVGYWRAVRAERQAAAERDRAVAAEARAKRRFDQLHELAQSFIFDFHQQVSPLAGSTPVREFLVTTALKYLDSLAREASDDPKLRQDLIAAYIKVGDVQGGVTGGNLGQTQGAGESYHKAQAICETWLRDDPNNPAARGHLSICHGRMSHIFAVLGKTDEALKSLLKALQITEKLARESPDDTERRRSLVVLHNKIGERYQAMGRAHDALESYHTGLRIAQSLSEADPDDDEFTRDVALGHVRISELLTSESRHKEALAECRKAMAIQEKLTAANPDNAQYARDVAILHYKIGHELLVSGAKDEAKPHYVKALERFKALAEADPKNAMARRDVAIGYQKLGGFNQMTGRLDEAVRDLRRALEIYEALSAADPHSAVGRSDIEGVLSLIGVVLLQAGKPTEAMEAFRKQLPLAESLSSADPTNATKLRHVAMAYCGMGDACAALARDEARPPGERLQRLREARDWYRRSRDIFLEMRERNMLTEPLLKFLEGIAASAEACDAALEKYSPPGETPTSAPATTTATSGPAGPAATRGAADEERGGGQIR